MDDREPDMVEHVDGAVGAQLDFFFGHRDPTDKNTIIPGENFDEAEFYRTVLEPKLLELEELASSHRIPLLVMTTFARSINPDDPNQMREDFIMMSTDPDDLRTGTLQRGTFAVCTDTNNWTIGPTNLLASNQNINDLLGGLLNGQQPDA